MKIIAITISAIGVSSFAAVGLLLPVPAQAADPRTHLRIAEAPVFDADAPIFDTVVYWGADLSHANSGKDGYGIDAGFVTALDGDIGAAGWTITGNLGASRTEDMLSESDSLYGALLLGHQWHTPGYYLTLAAGAHYVNNDETPPGGVTDGDEIGAIVQYGFETKAVDALYAQSYGALSTAFNQVYFHAKVGYKTPELRFGPEFTIFDDEGSEATLRYGAFVGDIPIFRSLSMVISAGYQDELEPGESGGMYATVGFSLPLSTR